ncbi:hypothetical protein GGR57DRAFT_511185 [Xylariaceae sp. FL1272]|nr:hypothetical protein GGR57DRAFT_511185 [Xylariaceae sp. FL1272]
MASDPTPAAPTLGGMPNEIILNIISLLGPMDRINMAFHNPSRFLSSSFHMWQHDARQVAVWQQSLRPVPRVEEDWPLIYTAISGNVPIEIIEKMMDVYTKICGAPCLSGIWGQYVSSFPPLFLVAIETERLDIIRLLLTKGADPSYLQDVEDIALSLFYHGASPLWHSRWPRNPVGDEEDLRVAQRFQNLLYYPIVANMSTLVEVVAEKDTQFFHFCARESFAIAKFALSEVACINQLSDEHHEILEYLIKLGAPLKRQLAENEILPGPNTFTSPDYSYLLDWALGRNCPRTAEYLLDLHIKDDVPLRFEKLAVREWSSELLWIARTKPLPLAFVQALFDAIEKGHLSKWYNGRSPKLLQQDLLDMHLVQPRYSSEVCEWLVEQGVGGALQFLTAWNSSQTTLVPGLARNMFKRR